MGIARTWISTSNGFGGYNQQQFFENTTEVGISDPLGGQPTYYPSTEITFEEHNPFHLDILSSGSEDMLAPAGGISLNSAAFADNGLFLEYWDINIVDEQEDVVAFEGVLQNDGLKEALAINNVNVPGDNITSIAGIPTLQPMYLGAEIDGYFNTYSGEFEASIEGYTTRGDYFYVEIYDDYNFV